MAGERRRFSVTVTKDKTATDTAQIPAESADVDLYLEGASASEAKTLTQSTPTTLTVYDAGDVLASDTLQLGTDDTTAITVNSVTQTQLNVTATSGDIDVEDGDRLVITNRRPTAYVYDRGSTNAVSGSPTLTTNAQGYAKCFLDRLNVDVIISGTGVTTTLYTDRGEPTERWDVTKYGVQGDGSTDDAAALNRVMQLIARSGGPVAEIYFPPGTYLLSSPVSVQTSSRSIRLVGAPGATLRPTTGGSPTSLFYAIMGTEGIEIRGLTFDNPNNTADMASGAICIEQHTLTSGTTDKVRIRDCIFKDLTPSSNDQAPAIVLGSSTRTGRIATNVWIEGNDFEDLVGPAVVLYNADTVRIVGNDFDNVDRSVWVKPQGIGYTMRDVHIKDNVMRDQKGPAIVIESTSSTTTNPHYDFQIVGNTIDSPSAAAADDAIYVDHVAGLHITNNIIRDSTDNGMQLYSIQDALIAGNTIVTCDIGIVVDRGSATDPNKNVRITQNTIRDAQKEGIQLVDVEQAVIEGNEIVDWAQAAGSDAAIQVSNAVATTDDIVVTGNFVGGNGGSGPGIIVGSGCTETFLVSNVLLSSTTVTDSATAGETREFGTYGLTGGTTCNTTFTMDGAYFKNAVGTVTESGSTLTLGEDGNYYEVDVANNYDTITPVAQAGTVIWIRANIASGGVGFLEGGNISLGSLSATSIIIRDEEAISFVSNGTQWLIAGMRDYWTYISSGSGVVYTPFGIRSTVGDGAYPSLSTTCTVDADGGITDSVAGAVRMEPGYTSTTGATVTNHSYIVMNNPTTAGSSPPSVTNGYAITFNAAAGTHKAVATGTTPSHGMTSPNAWIQVSIGGTKHYIPAYTSISP